MKKHYTAPKCDITRFESEDILVVSEVTQDGFTEFDYSDFIGGGRDDSGTDW